MFFKFFKFFLFLFLAWTLGDGRASRRHRTTHCTVASSGVAGRLRPTAGRGRAHRRRPLVTGAVKWPAWPRSASATRARARATLAQLSIPVAAVVVRPSVRPSVVVRTRRGTVARAAAARRVSSSVSSGVSRYCYTLFHDVLLTHNTILS